jgi:cytohesin
MKNLIQTICLSMLIITTPVLAADLEDAVIAGDMTLAETLITSGANVNQKGAMLGLRPLHYAVMASNKNMIELLLTKGANVNIQKNDGYTPLHLAAGRGNIAMVEFLIAKGADVTIKNNAGETPAMLAKDDKIKQLLSGNK